MIMDAQVFPPRAPPLMNSARPSAFFPSSSATAGARPRCASSRNEDAANQLGIARAASAPAGSGAGAPDPADEMAISPALSRAQRQADISRSMLPAVSHPIASLLLA